MTTTIPGGISAATTADHLAALGDLLGDCGLWPAATSFPELDDTVDADPPPDWAAYASLMGTSDPWPSGTSFPDIDD